MNRDKLISIDSALKEIIGRHPESSGSDYQDFLKSLAEHNTDQIPLDFVLVEKLKNKTIEPEIRVTGIVALIWYKKIRNSGIILLFLSLIFFTISQWSGTISIGPESGSYVNVSENQGSGPEKKEKNNRPNSLKSGTTFINPKKILPGQNVYQNEAGLKEKQWIRPLSRRIEMVENPENNLIKSFPRPELWILKSRNSGNPFLRFYLDDLDYSLIVDGLVPVRNDVKNESVDFKWKPGLNISLQVLNTFQFYQSELTDHAVRVANRNYPALMESGKMLGVAVNYGISVEKQFLNHWGLSAGFQKLNFNQIQETNYWLKEAPVINMNGEIAGYIAITPEHIHTLVENRLEYISMPVRLNYAVRLSPTGEIQFSAGSGLLGLLSQQLQKFDYRTLELKPYVNNAGRLTVNNILSGIHFSKDIGKQWAISAGYEWQKFFQIPQLSDPLEEIKSNNHNLTISLKYQYK